MCVSPKSNLVHNCNTNKMKKSKLIWWRAHIWVPTKQVQTSYKLNTEIFIPITISSTYCHTLQRLSFVCILNNTLFGHFCKVTKKCISQSMKLTNVCLIGLVGRQRFFWPWNIDWKSFLMPIRDFCEDTGACMPLPLF